MKNSIRSASSILLAAVVLALPGLAGAQQAKAPAPKVAKTFFQPNAILWEPQISHRFASLRVVGPDGFVLTREFGDLSPVLDLNALPPLADGQYKYELIFGKKPDAELARAISATEINDGGVIADAAVASKMLLLREVVAGAFRVQGGKLVSPDRVETAARQKVLLTAADGTVRNSLCVGSDCADAEAFGTVTMKLKEVNNRLLFEDTSAGTFPANDWQLTINETADGGLNKFSIEDITSARVPFTVEGGATTNSIYVDSTGRVGFRTNTPVLDLHSRTSNTPAIRLEQDNTGGFTAQTWDVGANEANFFIRDVTGGSRLSFRIRPGAPTSSIDIAADGRVGIGTGSPDSNSRLHVFNGVLNLDDDRAVAWGGGSGRPAILGNKPGQFFAMYTSGLERFRVDSSTLSVRDATPLAWGAGAARPAILGNHASNYLAMFTSGAERMRIDGVGKVTIYGQLAVSGPCCGPDYVFAPGFKLASIEENAAYMWEKRHLPAVGPARTTEDGRAIVDVFAQTKGILEELEKAHIYIEQLNKEIKALRAEAREREDDLQRQMTELKNLLRK